MAHITLEKNMIIESPQEIGGSVRSIIETNPLSKLLSQEKSVLSSAIEDYRETKQDTLNLKLKLKNSLIEQNVSKQLVRKSEIKIKYLEKTVAESYNEFKCDFLNRESMAQFFQSIGLRFISLNIAQSGIEARLSYARPARMISTLPVQPMIVTMYYELKNGTLRFKKPEITTVFSSSTNMHPHISGDYVCMGNYFDIFEEKDYSVLLEGYQDQVILLENLLSTFNPDSPYARIDQIIMAIANGISYVPYEYQVVLRDHYTFVNPKLSTEGAYNFYALDLITEELCRDYYAMLGSMLIRDTVQDIIDSLPNDYRNSDAASENFEHFQSYKNSLNEIFGITLPAPERFADHNEDDDYYSLEEGQFEDMIAEWIATLTPLLDTDTTFEFNNLPDLNEIFPKPVETATLTDASLAQEAVGSSSLSF